jgi:UDP-N-acetylmuramoylalanine--D-glutamate ligase
VSDVELLWRARRSARFVAITGTNGKSTTTALIAHVLKAAGLEIVAGGNIGTPALDLPALGPRGVYVLELSSYQLEITPSAIYDVAVLLNITPDHLDRHGGMDGYVAAKRLIFRGQGEDDTAIVGVDDGICRRIRADLAARGAQRVVAISAFDGAAGGVFAGGQWLIDDLDRLSRPLADLSRARALPGTHNGQNAAAAYAVARALDVPAEIAAKALLDFPGLAHRQELVGTADGVRFINDSKATNADAAARALESYENIFWIAGGIAKEGGIAPLAPFFPHIAHAFLIGQAAPDFARTLEGRVPHTSCGTLEAALDAAHKAARAAGKKPAVVLLSPACASFDQFKNFEARGDAFRALVRARLGAMSADARP